MVINKWKATASILAPLVGGTIVGTLANKNSRFKYEKLETPNFAPPGWVFPVAWTSLYTLMGVAKYQFDKIPKTASKQMAGNAAYFAQLTFNFIWSFLFFKWNLRGTALVDAMFLWISVMLNAFFFYQESNIAGIIMYPYICWTTYAVALNSATWKMNREKSDTLGETTTMDRR